MIHAENRRSAVRKIRGVAYALTLYQFDVSAFFKNDETPCDVSSAQHILTDNFSEQVEAKFRGKGCCLVGRDAKHFAAFWHRTVPK